MLPLVCKRWARLLRGPSNAWRDASIGCLHEDDDTEDEETGRPAVKGMNAEAVMDWFKSRPG